jgi:hypothetical protein
MAQTYRPILRVTPPAGATSTYDLSTYRFLSVVQPSWEPLFTEMEMLDRSTQQTRYGFRVSVALALEFPNAESASESTLATSIVTQAMDDAYSWELSLDAGATYRAVVLSQYSEARMGEKNIGLSVSMIWTCVSIVLTKPAVLGGGW